MRLLIVVLGWAYATVAFVLVTWAWTTMGTSRAMLAAATGLLFAVAGLILARLGRK